MIQADRGPKLLAKFTPDRGKHCIAVWVLQPCSRWLSGTVKQAIKTSHYEL